MSPTKTLHDLGQSLWFVAVFERRDPGHSSVAPSSDRPDHRATMDMEH